jgi:hypothetical protein
MGELSGFQASLAIVFVLIVLGAFIAILVMMKRGT